MPFGIGNSGTKGAPATVNELTGSLTANRIPYASGANTLANGSFTDDAAGAVTLTNGTAGKTAFKMNTSGLVQGNAVAAPTFSSGSVTSNVATITCTAAHNLVTGQILTVTGSAGVAVNGTYIITVTTATAFTFAKTVGNGTITAATLTPNAMLQLSAAPTTPLSTADVMLSASGVAQVPLVIQAKASQTADLMHFQTSTGGANSGVDKAGVIQCNTFSSVGGTLPQTTASLLIYQGTLYQASDKQIAWDSDTDVVSVTQDVGINRAAANVLSITRGVQGTNTGWIQNPAGDLVKTADQVVDSTTAANDTHLVTLSIATTRKIAFEADLFFSAGDTLTDGWVLSFDQGTATATDFIASAVCFDGGVATAVTNQRTTALATVMSQTITVNTDFEVQVRGHLTVNGAGTFGLKWGKEADAGTGLTLRKGSRLRLWDMP